MSSETTTVRYVPLDRDMARRLRRVARRVATATDERDALIVEAHSSGASQREIAEAVGLSQPGVLKIIRRTSTD